MCLRRMQNRLISFLFSAATISYSGSLLHFTLDPIAEIAANQTDPIKVRSLLQIFKTRKEQEIRFVRQAATLSAAAVIGCFSWPQAADSYWLGQLFWQISFWLSIFALISSAQDRLIERLPGATETVDDRHLKNILRLLLRPMRSDGESVPGAVLLLEPDVKMIWVWQTPMMLMSLSWVTFLVGYELYILTPFTEGKGWTVESASAVIATVVGALAIANFSLNSRLARSIISEIADVQTIASSESSPTPESSNPVLVEAKVKEEVTSSAQQISA